MSVADALEATTREENVCTLTTHEVRSHGERIINARLQRQRSEWGSQTVKKENKAMERNVNLIWPSRIVLSMLAALLVTVAAMAAGYGVRALTSSTSGHTDVVSAGRATSATTPQSDAPCQWIDTRKAC